MCFEDIKDVVWIRVEMSEKRQGRVVAGRPTHQHHATALPIFADWRDILRLDQPRQKSCNLCPSCPQKRVMLLGVGAVEHTEFFL